MTAVERCFFFTGSQRRIRDGLTALGYVLEAAGEEAWQGTFFDTHSGSLFRRGIRLLGIGDPAQWRWLRAEPTPAADALPDEGPAVLPPPDDAPVEWRGQRLLPVLRVSVRRKMHHLTARSGQVFQLSVGEASFARPMAREWIAGRRLVCLSVPDGQESEVAVIGSFLRDLFRLKPMPQDLLVYGLDVVDQLLPGAPVPARLKLKPGDTLREAGHKLLSRQAFKMRANIEGARMDLDPEFVHDIRVATRRARFALRLLGEELGQAEAETLRAELAWIAGLLGEVRDLDIMQGNLHRYTEELAGRPAVPAAIRAHLHSARVEALAALNEALADERFAQLLTRLERIAADARGQTLSEPSRRVIEAAPPLIRSAMARLQRWLKRRPAELTPAQLHRIRIHFKRLRYTCEFFNDLFADAFASAINHCVDYQDCLGEHQDAQVAQTRLREMAERLAQAGGSQLETLIFVGSMIQRLDGVARDCRRIFEKRWKQFPWLIADIDASMEPGTGSEASD
ncbi:MAG TPA: CHAD domain-containing protein [Acidobacteriota bacterium]|jgi:CHAD domain-containing protein|nr:CHAD domain-containing protein [Acidobacteriota bacterium]HNR38823.1 CHAD domain-containing protein [Acidobacteriota bacterium]HNU00344.1 CHAD domain-containing protein [Acidobacteriota bacterium]HPB27212.1 CHAD domain-containing protein [Acidobacteriota bacterium]HQP73281.1 CHAD domain-containing protein [Acidobacteriota bacterium]